MTREEYKRAKRRWIIQPLVGVAAFLVLCALAHVAANAICP